MSFSLHPQLVADTYILGDLELCTLLLMNDRQYPWFILVPRRNGLREIHELADADQLLLLKESNALSRWLMTEFKPDKLNIAALGNMVPQLHIHHIARFKSDPAWPAPVWGKVPSVAYEEDGIASIREKAAVLAG